MPNQGDSIHYLHKIDDKTALELMKELLAVFPSVGVEIHVEVAQGYRYSLTEWGEKNVKAGSYTILGISAQGVVDGQLRASISINRNYDDGTKSSKYFDRLQIVYGNEAHRWQPHISLIRQCTEIISRYDTPASLVDTGSSPDVLRELMVSNSAIHRQMMDQLHKAMVDMTTKRAQLEEEAARLEAERRQSFLDTQKELEAQREDLQRQSYMATRRKTGESINRIMTQPLHKEFATRQRRSIFALLVFFAYFGLGMAGAFGTWHTLTSYQFAEAGQTASVAPTTSETTPPAGRGGDPVPAPILDADAFRWLLLVKLVLSSVVTIGGFVAAANWMRRHLDTETRLIEEKIAYIADVERATWVIEAIHEVKQEAGADLPQEWVEAVTRNLFSPKQASAELDDGAQALRALVALAANVKIGPQGLQMEINRKGTKAIGSAGD